VRNHILPLALLALLSACADDPMATRPAAPEPAPAPKLVGMVEITLRGVGTPNLSATIAPAAGPRLALSSVPGGTIQLRRLSASAVDVGTRGAGGERYVQAVFEVRNADLAGTPYTTPRQNLTFVPVASSATLPGTPVRSFLKQDGTAADPALAQQLRPTGAVAADGAGGVVPQYADVLQALTEAEAQSLSLVAGATPFPYGFVTRYATQTGTRELPASPAAEQYDGRVTFAFRLPLAATADQDAYTISITAAAMDDSETRVTQSLEEQTVAGQAAFEARAAALGATRVVLLPGGSYGGPIAQQTICGVRTAGTPGAPTAFLGGAPGTFQSLAPNPYAGALLGRTSPVVVNVSGCAAGASSASFRVNSFQSSSIFLQGSVASSGSTATYSHAGPFFAGEQVEISLLTGLVNPARVVRFQVATAPATGQFAPAGLVNAPSTADAMSADMNGDGRLDVVHVVSSEGLAVQLGVGDGTFAPAGTLTTTPSLLGLEAVGDLTNDGLLDVVVRGSDGGGIIVYPGDGKGGFTAGAGYSAHTTMAAALGDMNADGLLDVALVSRFGIVTVLLNGPIAGNGSTGPQHRLNTRVETLTGVSPSSDLDLADYNGDGRLDAVVTYDGEVRVMLGDGTGAFGPSTRVTTLTPPLPGRTPHQTLVGDVDGNGSPDLVTVITNSDPAGTTNTLLVMRGDGTGAFPLQSSSSIAGAGTMAVDLGDVDGDGVLDVVTAKGGTVQVLRGDGAGGFTLFSTIAVTPSLNRMMLGDLNNDARLDVALTHAATRQVSSYLNQ
jgi:hypothetical protein